MNNLRQFSGRISDRPMMASGSRGHRAEPEHDPPTPATERKERPAGRFANGRRRRRRLTGAVKIGEYGDTRSRTKTRKNHKTGAPRTMAIDAEVAAKFIPSAEQAFSRAMHNKKHNLTSA